ncbi:hypothetical protein ACMFMG_012102 [Clarireedia jacksonii]
MDCFATAWTDLLPESRTAILNRVGSSETREPRRHRIWNTKTNSKTPIEIDKDINARLPFWKSYPLTFFDQHPMGEFHDHNLLSIGGFRNHNLPSQLYLKLRSIEINTSIQSVQWRFLLLAFYDLRNEFLHQKYFASNVADDFISIICKCDLVKETKDIVKENCARWINAGGRYYLLAEELGGKGALLLLPGDISRTVLEHEMPKSGKDHEKMIKSLKSRGLYKDANSINAYAYEVADIIWKSQREHMDLWIRVRPDSDANRNRPTIDAGLATFASNPNSINSLLNPAESQSRQFLPVRRSSIPITSARPEIGLQSQPEARTRPSKRKRVGSSSVLDPSSQSSSEVTHDQGGAQGSPAIEVANISAVSPAGGAHRTYYVATVVMRDKLDDVLGAYLLEGIRESVMRKREGVSQYTDVVRLHIPHPIDDYKLEIWLCSSVGKAISQTVIQSIEDWRNILGDYLFEGMKASNSRKEEVEAGTIFGTRSVHISFPNSDSSSDYKIEVILSSGIGQALYDYIFPK